MKTPMQKAIDKVSFVRNMCDDENNEMTIKHVLDTLKEDLNVLLKEEKEHIIAAANFLPHDEQNKIKTPKEYYDNKYQNNMKTPMQEMIQNIIDIESKTYNQEQLYMLSALKVVALVFLKEEKKHIIDAFVECWKANMLDGFECKLSAEEYYNEKYKNK